MDDILTILMAGGAGERLNPLMREQAKPALPFGGIYRPIDITLSNGIDSGLMGTYILTQYKALTLNRHVRQAWHFLPPELGAFVETLPPMRRGRDTWDLGTADAVYRNLASIVEEAPPYALILSAGHVHKMDYRPMLDWQSTRHAGGRLATTQATPVEASRFAIVRADSRHRITGFEEESAPEAAARSPFNGGCRMASPGIYLFSTPGLRTPLFEDAEDPDSTHDFESDALPRWIHRAKVSSYQFVDENRKTPRSWRDVGTLDACYGANMDLVAAHPEFNLDDGHWPWRASIPSLPPAKFVFGDEPTRTGAAIDSLVSHGFILSGSRFVRGVHSPKARVNSFSQVGDSMVFENVSIGRNRRIRRAIIKDNLEIPAGFEVGLSPEADRERGHCVTESGIAGWHGGSPGLQKRNTRALHPAATPTRAGTNGDHEFAKALSPGGWNLGQL